ncbi:MAG: glutamine--fructose-6-phosphate transaminase (isomerizing) [Clostridiaceae bacterium]|nr:glutamine--fructose-6-phosphate transaminase (isomerizing) [Clostridia bacterium]MDY3870428.1 glutamine--fructose-6-phosphate transaminase (isomerizing) [Clostridiaceae bacterium]
MCGIVGYVGAKQAVPVLLQGLYKLEYRGYDSAGVALLEQGALRVIKTRGRIKNLEELTRQQGPFSATCGIGHTRWATHGEPSDINAHPHVSGNGRVALVHNGIIENYLELREMLKKAGFTIQTQTDSEVVAHLFQMHYRGDVVQALRETVKHLRGSYALGVITADAPDQLVCTRRDNPLIIGVGEGENMIASDIPAILALTKRYIVLSDNQIARITAGGVEITDELGTPVEPRVETVTWDVAAAEKGGYEHFMMKEIFEQPKAVRDTIAPRLRDGLPALEEEGLSDELFRNVRNIHITACGSALHAGLVGKQVIERLARVPVMAQVASEFRYCDPIIGPEDLCIVISQSGETADTLAALREARRKGAKVIAIVNVVSSSAAREADGVLYTWAGPEIAVATTKAYSAQLAALYLIAVRAGLARGTLSRQQALDICAHIAGLPRQIEETLACRAQMQHLASLYANRHSVFFIGRGTDHTACQEASLKLKEISYVHSEAYAAGELKHGTISLIEPGTLVVALACEPALVEKTVSNIKAVKARGASVILVTNDDALREDPEICDHLVRVPRCPAVLSPSLSIVPMQLLAYYVSVMRGCDVDKPRNLAKSVTVE